MNFKDEVVVITGGSQGFGKAMAQAFVREEARVVISSHSKENLASTARELSVDSFLADVTSYEDVKRLGEYVFSKNPINYVLIHNNSDCHILKHLSKALQKFGIFVFFDFLKLQI